MKNFYEILEINENASQEIVEKAYKVLVKKYHPDLQTDPEQKQKYEVKIKEINEAYETLSNEKLRLAYDEQLKQEQYEKLKSEVQYQVNTQQAQKPPQENYINPNRHVNTNQKQQVNTQRPIDKQFEKDYRNAVNQAYQDAYVKRLKDMGYRIKYKKTPKEIIKTIIVITVTILIIFLILQLPPVKSFFKDLYDNNSIFKSIVDFFTNLFNKPKG